MHKKLFTLFYNFLSEEVFTSSSIHKNTTPPDKRVQLLKPVNDIKEMEDDREDVYTTSLLQRYAKRPFCLEHLTLADWAQFGMTLSKGC